MVYAGFSLGGALGVFSSFNVGHPLCLTQALSVSRFSVFGLKVIETDLRTWLLSQRLMIRYKNKVQGQLRSWGLNHLPKGLQHFFSEGAMGTST